MLHRLLAEVEPGASAAVFSSGEGEEGAHDRSHRPRRWRSTLLLMIFGVGDDDGTVEVVLRAGRLLMLIEHAGVEDRPDTVVDAATATCPWASLAG